MNQIVIDHQRIKDRTECYWWCSSDQVLKTIRVCLCVRVEQFLIRSWLIAQLFIELYSRKKTRTKIIVLGIVPEMSEAH